MITINLLKEGHGILYEPYPVRIYYLKKITCFVGFCSLIFIIYLIYPISYKKYAGLKISGYSKNIPLNKEKNNDKEKIPAPNKDHNMSDSKPVPSSTYNKISEKTFKPAKKISVEKKEGRVKSQRVLSANYKNTPKFKIIAGTCLLKKSANHILEKLKNKGFSDSFIERSKVKLTYYTVVSGRFNLDDADAIYKKVNGYTALKTHEADNRYFISSPLYLSEKDAKKNQQVMRRKGINGKVKKVKKEKDAYLVVAGIFNSRKEALAKKKDLKRYGIEAILTSGNE